MTSGVFLGQIDYDDLGFWRGWSVFEAMEARGKTIFHFEDHFKRLIKSCELSGILLPTHFSFDTLQKQLEVSLGVELEKSETKEFLIKVLITQGDSSDHKTPKNGKSNWHYRILPLPATKSEPLKLVVKKAIKSNFPEIKSVGSYHDAMILREQAKTDGFDDFLYFYDTLSITESSTANIFFVYECGREKVLATPQNNILFGVTRRTVINLARNSGIFYAILEMPSLLFTKNLLKESQECFLTSTTIGVKEVKNITDIDGGVYNFDTGKNTTTHKLKELFLRYREDCLTKHPA